MMNFVHWHFGSYLCMRLKTMQRQHIAMIEPLGTACFARRHIDSKLRQRRLGWRQQSHAVLRQQYLGAPLPLTIGDPKRPQNHGTPMRHHFYVMKQTLTIHFDFLSP